MKVFNIAEKNVGSGENIFIVAELSANHNQSIETAKKTIAAAKEAGADAVKIQTYTADTLTIDCDKPHFKISGGTIWDGITLYKLYQRAFTPWQWHEELRDFARSTGITLFSTPFDRSAADLLDSLEMPAYKIASFEITDIDLIKYVASKNKPVIISTGIASLAEIEDAVTACKETGNNKIALLKCTSAYPAPPEEANLSAIKTLEGAFNTVTGLSDHSEGTAIAVGAAALGAHIIEKHFILNKNIGGPDAEFSMEPAEFTRMVKDIRTIEKAKGSPSLLNAAESLKGRQFARSLFAVKDIKSGEEFTYNNIRSIRPGYGLAPKYLKYIIGKRARCDISYGTPLSFDLLI